jgi:hypothetical protein
LQKNSQILFFLKIEKKIQPKKKGLVWDPLGHFSKIIQEKRQNIVRKVHNNMIDPKVQNEFLIYTTLANRTLLSFKKHGFWPCGVWVNRLQMAC